MCARVDQSQYSDIELSRMDGKHRPFRREVFPLQQLGFIRRAAGGALEAAEGQWGLVPAWAKEAKFGRHTYNARAETVAEKPSFREAFRRRRAVIPIDGFYEHADKLPAEKLLMAICRLQPGVLWAAGLWEWNPTLSIQSVTLITCEPNALIGQVHSRMPVLLQAGEIEAWLDRGGPELLRPAPAAELAMLNFAGRPGWEDVRANQARLNVSRAAASQAGEDMGGAWPRNVKI